MNNFYKNSVYQFSDVRLENEYRYYLRAEILNPKSNLHLLVVQLNPSKADGSKSDATAGKVCNWVARNKYHVIHFLNLFALIETKQERISSDASYEKLVGFENNKSLDQVVNSAPKDKSIVFAYGEPKGILREHYNKRVIEVENQLRKLGVNQIFRVGPLVKGKYPRHGRAWNKNVQLEVLDFHAAAQN